MNSSAVPTIAPLRCPSWSIAECSPDTDGARILRTVDGLVSATQQAWRLPLAERVLQ